MTTFCVGSVANALSRLRRSTTRRSGAWGSATAWAVILLAVVVLATLALRLKADR
jgi:anti-sigma-K factor RskA